MKNVMLAFALAALVTPVAFANDAANENKTTVDHSDNPITGTHTKTVKHKKAMKGRGGNAKMETTEKTKTYSDGTQKKTVEVEGESSNH